MPEVKFDPEERRGSPFDFPKLKLRHGERARVNILQEKPLADYVHTFRAPIIINGRAETEQVRQGDGTITRPKMSFIGQVLCIGDYDSLKDKGFDPRCPACEASQKHSDAIPPPQRRFAVHAIQYQTKPGGFEIAEPYQVSVVAWAFPQRTFDKLIDLLQEHEQKDLRHHDLNLGPCENEGFQKFDIQMSAKAGWLESEQRKMHTAEVWKNNQAPDLAAFIGRRSGRDQISEDVQTVLLRYRQMQGVPSPDPESSDPEAGPSLLDEMMGTSTESAPAASPVDDLLSVEPAPAPNGEEAKEPVPFEDLLKIVEGDGE